MSDWYEKRERCPNDYGATKPANEPLTEEERADYYDKLADVAEDEIIDLKW